MKELLIIFLVFIILCIGIGIVIVEYTEEPTTNNITIETIDSIISTNHNEILLEYSLQSMRREIDSLKQLVANTNTAWLTIYDNLVGDSRYDWTVGLTTEQIDSILERN